MEKLIGRVEELEANARQRYHRQPACSGQQSCDEVVYEKCGKNGHYARGCVMRNTSRRTDQDIRKLDSARIEEHDLQTIAINNVSSYTYHAPLTIFQYLSLLILVQGCVFLKVKFGNM